MGRARHCSQSCMVTGRCSRPSWTQPMHGEVTEVLCASHEPPARAALREPVSPVGVFTDWLLVA
jgi:hypothetical protein